MNNIVETITYDGFVIKLTGDGWTVCKNGAAIMPGGCTSHTAEEALASLQLLLAVGGNGVDDITSGAGQRFWHLNYAVRSLVKTLVKQEALNPPRNAHPSVTTKSGCNQPDVRYVPTADGKWVPSHPCYYANNSYTPDCTGIGVKAKNDFWLCVPCYEKNTKAEANYNRSQEEFYRRQLEMMPDQSFCLNGPDGPEWRILVNGKVCSATWSDKGAADAGIPVERARQAKRAQAQS